MAGHNGHDHGNVSARIDHDRLMRRFIPDNGAITLQRTDCENLMDHKPDDRRKERRFQSRTRSANFGNTLLAASPLAGCSVK
jgi:hypothetical protein